MCSRKCAAKHPCSQQYGSSRPNHDEPRVAPADRVSKRVPRTKQVLIEALHGLGIEASTKTLLSAEVNARRADLADVGGAVPLCEEAKLEAAANGEASDTERHDLH